MELMLREWEKSLWKTNQLEESKESVFPQRTRQQEIWEWDDYVLKNWIEPMMRNDGLSAQLA